MSPLVALTVRLSQLGEIFGAGSTRTDVRLRGTVFDDYAEYKLTQTLIRQPNVPYPRLVAGYALRAAMFAGCQGRPSCVYNAGGAMPDLRTGLEFLRLATERHAPRVLLPGIDLWQLNPQFDPTKHERTETLRPDPLRRLDDALPVIRRLALQAINDDALRRLIVDPSAVPPSDIVGARAASLEEGFRPDGSYRYGPREVDRVIALSSAGRAADAIALIAQGCASDARCPFAHFERVDDSSIVELEQLLDLAAQRHIQVIAFTPPLANEVALAVERDPGLRAGVALVRRALCSIFAQRGLAFLNALELSDVGCEPSEQWDGIHPSEICAARILGRAAADRIGGQILRPYVDVGALNALVDERSSSLRLGPDE